MSGLFGEGSMIVSPVWGGQPYPVSQEFGEYNPALADWYQYAADHGFPAGTHIGLDIGIPKYTTIHAAESGVVEFSGPSDSWRPNPVGIREDDGQLAIYGHLWESTVPVGKRVRRGDIIGKSGEQTKLGTRIPDGSGPHLHFELWDENGNAVDPGPELTGSTVGYYDETATDNGGGNTWDLDVPDILSRGGVILLGVVLIGIGGAVLLGIRPGIL